MCGASDLFVLSLKCTCILAKIRPFIFSRRLLCLIYVNILSLICLMDICNDNVANIRPLLTFFRKTVHALGFVMF